ncbi:MAG: hypothetical protein Solumvirus6_2 [Solumvirus sp.]|uniref:Uncharacterized protein n=1 Tax=Solumvirus sp. TaxID=2487773 RepID=A0A3G5AGP8_9VIRU|nr:MAG: hypothetical protein Solumvirus6_2 [Solumvirus sp.]
MPKPRADVLQILPLLGLPLLSAPNSGSTPIEQLVGGLLVRRLNDQIFPDQVSGTGNNYVLVAVTEKLSGYLLLNTVVGGVVTVTGLGKTVLAITQEAILQKLLDRQHKKCESKCHTKKH